MENKPSNNEASSGTSALDDGLCRAAFALYRPPFRFEHGYIWDAGNNMVADQDDACSDAVSNEIARVRGWGRICSMPEPMALQDKAGELIAAALTEYWTRHNVEFSGTPAALSPEAPLERRVGGAVPREPTFERKERDSD